MARISLAFPLVLAFALVLVPGCIGPQNPSTPTATTEPPSPTSALDPGCTPPTVVNTPTAGAGQGGVSNNPGAFSYGGQAAAKVGKEDYLWTNPSPTARASFGGQVATGTVHLVIKDACGKVELDKMISQGQGGNYGALPEGRPGKWLIALEFTAFTGQMGLSVTS